MSALIISEEARLRAHEIALYAAQPEHWYRPGDSVKDDGSARTAIFQSYRCVFSYSTAWDTTHTVQALFRHLSISLVRGRRGAFPQPIVVFTIATWFGFTGATIEEQLAIAPGKDWLVAPNSKPFAFIAIAQRIDSGPAGHVTFDDAPRSGS